MFRTAGALVTIFGVIFGGAYALDRLAKAKMRAIEKQENDEVELDDCCNCGCCNHEFEIVDLDEEEEHKCCGNCKDCNCGNKEE